MRIQIVSVLHLELRNPIPELAPGTDALVDHRTGVAASVPKRWAWRPSSTCSPGTEVDGKHETIVWARTRPLRPVKCTAAD